MSDARKRCLRLFGPNLGLAMNSDQSLRAINEATKSGGGSKSNSVPPQLPDIDRTRHTPNATTSSRQNTSVQPESAGDVRRSSSVTNISSMNKQFKQPIKVPHPATTKTDGVTKTGNVSGTVSREYSVDAAQSPPAGPLHMGTERNTVENIALSDPIPTQMFLEAIADLSIPQIVDNDTTINDELRVGGCDLMITNIDDQENPSRKRTIDQLAQPNEGMGANASARAQADAQRKAARTATVRIPQESTVRDSNNCTAERQASESINGPMHQSESDILVSDNPTVMESNLLLSQDLRALENFSGEVDAAYESNIHQDMRNQMLSSASSLLCEGANLDLAGLTSNESSIVTSTEPDPALINIPVDILPSATASIGSKFPLVRIDASSGSK